MDNKAIAGILYETADLLEIDGQDSFRIRSYRNAAEAIEAQPQQIADLIDDPKKVLAIPGIGKGMLLNLQEMFKEGKLSLHAELLKKYHPSMLDLLKIQGLGPKTIALIWSAYQVSDLEGVEKLAREGKIRELPAHGREAGTEAAEGHRRLSPHRRTLPARRRRTAGRKDHRAPPRISRRRKSHARRLAAPRTRNRRRSRHSGHGQGLLR